MSDDDDSVFAARAEHGNVVLECSTTVYVISRREAAQLARDLASALQLSGDISDPDAVVLVEAAAAFERSLRAS